MPIMSRRQKNRLWRAVQPGVRSGWNRSIAAIRKLARFSAVLNAIEGGSVADVVRAMDVSEARYMLDFIESVREAYRRSGQAYMDALPARVTEPFGGVFDSRSSRSQQFIENFAAKRVKDIRTDQVKAVRLVLQMGQARGDNPRRTALDLIGRISRATGRREGGIIGLSEQMTRWKLAARDQLESGDPARMKQYLRRARRDRRFDGIVQRAIDEGVPVARADVDRMTARYADRLVALRGEAIARTESAEAVGHAAQESLMQAVEDGVLEEEQVRRTWRSAMDGQVRGSHSLMNGQERGLREPFEFPLGGAAMFPCDGSLGAPARELINCRCWVEENLNL